MPITPRWAASWSVIARALSVLLILSLLPSIAVAQIAANLRVGAPALVANAGGELVSLRDGPGYDANVLAALSEGTPVDLIDGPITAQDGSVWYGVATAGQSGFMVVDYLAQAGATEAAAAPAAEPTTIAAPITTAQTLQTVPAAAAETAIVNEAVNLRAEPNGDAAILGVVPSGGVVTRNGDGVAGFVPVLYEGLAGWVAVNYLTIGGSAPATDAAPGVTEADPVPASPAPAAAMTISDVNLRAGPSRDDAILGVVPAGASVVPTGESVGGYLGVSYQGINGWIDAAYLGLSEGEAATAPVAPVVDDLETTDVVNLRAGPSLADPVLTTLPSGAALDATGAPLNGFYPVAVGGLQGWVAETFVASQDAPSPDGQAGRDTPTLRPTADQRFTGLIWPVTGGLWYISQGYSGSSHQNGGSLWQYLYSFDLAKVEGDTGGQTIISPANGTVRWLDPSTGGISIDVGNGHAVALFHVTVDGGWQAGDPISQGDFIGTISGPGGPGGTGFPHVHFTLWETTDGGNWSRVAAPFVGAYSISGQEFPDVGGGFQHQGVRFQP